MKKTIRLNERELHRMISESVKRVLNEECITSHAGDILNNCARNVRSVLNGIRNEFVKVYDMTRDAANDGDSFHDAISAFRDLMSKFTHHEYEMQINNAFKPIIDTFMTNNQANGEDYSEPEDWYERNEHGDFDTF